MIIVINSKGEIISQQDENYFMGSTNVNVINLIAPFASNVTFKANFEMPDGSYKPENLEGYIFERSIQVAKDSNIWSLPITFPITQDYGIVKMQIRGYIGNQIVCTCNASIPIQKGVPYDSQYVDSTTYDQILEIIQNLQAQLTNKVDKIYLSYEVAENVSHETIGTYYVFDNVNNVYNQVILPIDYVEGTTYYKVNVSSRILNGTDAVELTFGKHELSWATLYVKENSFELNIFDNSRTKFLITKDGVFFNDEPLVLNRDLLNAINTHNADPNAHPDIQAKIDNFTTVDFVKTTPNQNLTKERQTNARDNINALEKRVVNSIGVSITLENDGSSFIVKYDRGLPGSVPKIIRINSSGLSFKNEGGSTAMPVSSYFRPKVNDTEDMAYLSDLDGFITNAVNDLVNYYTKTEVNDLIGNITTIHFIVVDALPETGESNAIYLVPAPEPNPNNVKEEYIWTDNAWELIGSTAIDLTGYATETYVQNTAIDYIGREQQADFNAILENNEIIASLDDLEGDFQFTTSTSYLFHIYLPLTTLTGELDDTYPIYLLDKAGNRININCINQLNITQTSTVGDLCQIQNYDNGIGYSWFFHGHYREITNQDQSKTRVIYTADITRETNPSMTGQSLHNAVLNGKLKVGTTVLCTRDYSINGYTYTAGTDYLITGDFTGGELILDTIALSSGARLIIT